MKDNTEQYNESFPAKKYYFSNNADKQNSLQFFIWRYMQDLDNTSAETRTCRWSLYIGKKQ